MMITGAVFGMDQRLPQKEKKLESTTGEKFYHYLSSELGRRVRERSGQAGIYSEGKEEGGGLRQRDHVSNLEYGSCQGKRLETYTKTKELLAAELSQSKGEWLA